MHKKGLKVASVLELAKLDFTYITVHTKTRPGFDDQPEYPFVQIDFSSPWLNIQGKSSRKLCKISGLLS